MVLAGKLLFDGVHDKAFSREKVPQCAHWGGCGAVPAFKMESSRDILPGTFKNYPFGFLGRQSFSQPAAAPHPPPSGAPSPRRGLEPVKQQFVAQSFGFLVPWLLHWGSCRRLRECHSNEAHSLRLNARQTTIYRTDACPPPFRAVPVLTILPRKPNALAVPGRNAAGAVPEWDSPCC